jgi:cellobiose dehydrogenase (acceptor)
MVPATNRVFGRIPGTDHPSLDGRLYNQQGYDVITSGLTMAGWKNLTHVNDYPALKSRTFGQTEYMFSYGERGGPLATYLVSSKARKNFNLWFNTTVKRVVRSGDMLLG